MRDDCLSGRMFLQSKHNFDLPRLPHPIRYPQKLVVVEL